MADFVTGTSALIPVFTGTLSNSTARLCDARALHAFMQVKRDFSNWIKGRIRKFGFEAGTDFLEVFAKSGENLGGRPSIDYHLTLDMAKELSMVENNDMGRQARRYFIACEAAATRPARITPAQPAPEPAQSAAPAAPSRQQIDSALRAAEGMASAVRSAVLDTVLRGGDDWKHQRWLLRFVTDSQYGAPPLIFSVPKGAVVPCTESAAPAAPLDEPLPAIDPAALLLSGQSDPSATLPPELQKAIDLRAWTLAHEAYGLVREHLARRVAFQAVSGVPRRVDVPRAQQVISEGNLGAALARTWHDEMRMLTRTAEMSLQISLQAVERIRAASAQGGAA